MRRRDLYTALLVAALLSCSTGCQAIRDLLANISDGAACTDGSQCLGGTCVSAASGFPEGYCTTLMCETEGCSNLFGAECLALNQVRGEPMCFAQCALDDDCRQGYGCTDLDGDRVCLPLELASGFPAAGEIGTSCARDDDCLGGSCMLNLTGGYCTRMNCLNDIACQEFGDARCVEQGELENTFRACYDGCSNDAECRFGYGCSNPDGSGGVCQPLDDEDLVRNPTGADDGEPCAVDINCKGGTCLRDSEGYPEGYCTTLSCSRLGCNVQPSVCLGLENNTACFTSCVDDIDCRVGYRCRGEGYCGPPTQTALPADLSGAVELVCESEPVDGGRQFRFDIAPETVAFTVVPLSDTETIRPVRLHLPNDTVGVDFDGNYSFMDVNWQLLETIAPAFFPAAPQFEFLTQAGGGQYALDVETSDRSPCYYLLQKGANGARLAVNLYLVGVPNATAASAPTDSTIQNMLAGFRSVYLGAGIDVDEVRFFDVSPEDVERFRIIRSLNDVHGLLSVSEAPGETLAEQLSVNIFLIQDFAVPEAPGLLGLSAGIPGVPGLHGTHGSGLIFTSAPLASNSSAMAQTMAHEVGHFLGLRHTTEHDGIPDPIADTPRCGDPNAGAACPDAENFMFPFSIGGVTQTDISPGQAQVLRWAPLTQ